MTDDRPATSQADGPGTPPTVKPASPRFDGTGTQVSLSALPASFRDPLASTYAQLASVADVPGGEPFLHDKALGGFAALRAAGSSFLQGAGSEADKLAVAEALGARFRACSEHVPRWGRGRITKAYHDQVRFLAQDQRRVWRNLFDGLDDAARLTDRQPQQMPASRALMHWDRPVSDRDAQVFTVEARGTLTGHVASDAELVTLTRAVQSLLDRAEGRGRLENAVLEASDEPGQVCITLRASVPSAREPSTPNAAAGLVARAFALGGPKDAIDARLVGERASGSGVVGWVRWPTVP